MYTFRTITSSNKQINQLIGDDYSFIDSHVNYDEFSDVFLECFGINHIADLDETANELTKTCHAFLEYKGEYIPLYVKNNYYIMTESGKTFSNLSYRQVEKK